MKICIDGREFIGRRKTGIGRHLENLLLPLSTNEDADLVLFTHDPELVPESVRNSRVKTVVLASGPTVFVDQVVMPRAAASERADVFFSPYYKIPFTGAFKRAITVHDIMFLKVPEITRRRRIASAIQLRLAVSRSDLVLVDSEFTREELHEMIPGSHSKTQVLYPNLETCWSDPVDIDTVKKAKLRFAGSQPFVMYVGNFKPHKNVDLLVESFLQLADRGDTRGRSLLLIGGDPVNLPRIENMLRHSSSSHLVRIHTDVDDRDLRSLYHAADWTITLSEYEGFGYPMVEAMASGCPVVCHPCSSLAEITEGCALPVMRLSMADVLDTLTNAFEIPDTQRAELVERGRTRAEGFLSGISARRLFEEFSRITR